MEKIKVASDFSGAGAFEYAMDYVFGENYESEFACDIDKFAKQAFLANHKVKEFFTDVYERTIPSEPLDIYMSSPPCQGFSIAGKREGSILFFNTHEFIMKNRPRFFIIENVAGLLSHEGGRTFQEWQNYLGGKSINGLPVLFPIDEAAPYHLHFNLMNSKKHGVAQNRNRIFLVGIRDDKDNFFTWPKEEYLTKRLRDYLEDEVDQKYICSEKLTRGLIQKEGGFADRFKPKDKNDIANCITATSSKSAVTANYIKVGYINQDTQASQVFDEAGISPTLSAGTHGYANGYVCIPVLTPDRLNKRQNGRRFKNDGDEMFTLTAQDRHGIYDGLIIRRLTPIEAFRIQTFPDSFVEKCREIGISDSQLYKMAGNSITVDVLAKILTKIKTIIYANNTTNHVDNIRC